MRAAPCREAFSYHQILSPQYNAAKRDGRGKAAHTHTHTRAQASGLSYGRPDQGLASGTASITLSWPLSLPHTRGRLPPPFRRLADTGERLQFSEARISPPLFWTVRRTTNPALGPPLDPFRGGMGILHSASGKQDTRDTATILLLCIILALKGQGSGKMHGAILPPRQWGRPGDTGDGRNGPCAVRSPPLPHPLPWHLGPRRDSFSAAGRARTPLSLGFFLHPSHTPLPGRGAGLLSRHTAACAKGSICF